MSGGSSSCDHSSSFGLHRTPLWARCRITAFPRRTTSSASLRPDRFANKVFKRAYAKATQVGRCAALSWWGMNASPQTEHKSQNLRHAGPWAWRSEVLPSSLGPQTSVALLCAERLLPPRGQSHMLWDGAGRRFPGCSAPHLVLLASWGASSSV